MEEKMVKKLSMRLYKLQLELEKQNDEKLSAIIKEIEAIDYFIAKKILRKLSDNFHFQVV